ncbi:MAG: class I SAM-dependent methyltransferase [Candidatus Stahlbacteria bacterium]|nr:class I SAM-dependent methyltransferase [Candidatus Stahlbacteria bacterium]
MKPIDCGPIYRNGRYYDIQNKDFVDDISFYLHKIKNYGEPVLELACGTGRITIPMAEQGIQITGLDISEPMLAQAKRKAERIDIEWVKADCRDFKLSKKFNLIFVPFNSIAHIHDLESIKSCLSYVKMHLKDNGRFIIDIFNPCLNILTRDPSNRYPVAEYPDPDGKGNVVITENNVYDSATQINYIKWYYKIGNQAKEIVEELNLRMFYPQEIDAILYYNGLMIEDKFGNYDETPFMSTSPKQIIVCYIYE